MRKDVALGIVFWIMCIIILAIASYYYSSFSWARPYFTLENEILAGLVLFPVCIFLSMVYEAYKGEPRHYRSYRQEYRPHRERPNIKETSSDYESSFSKDEEDAHQRGYDEERGRQDAREDYYEEKRQEREYRRRQKEAQDNLKPVSTTTKQQFVTRRLLLRKTQEKERLILLVVILKSLFTSDSCM